MAGLTELLQTRPKQNMNDFLAFYLPELLKQQMQLEQVKKQSEIWLQNQLKEYQAYGDIQSKQGKEAFIRETLGKLINPEYFKERPMPELQTAKTIRDYFPANVVSELGINIPPAAETSLADSILAGRGALNARQTLDNIPADQLATLVRTIGYKPVLETVQEIQKEKQARDEMALRGRELTETEKGNVLRGREIGVREAEAGMAGTAGKQTTKDLKAELKEKEAERQEMANMYYGFKGSLDFQYTDEKNKTVVLDEKKKGIFVADLIRISREVKELKSKLGIKPDADLVERVKRIKAQKYNIKSLFDDEELIKALTDRGINPLYLIEYW